MSDQLMLPGMPGPIEGPGVTPDKPWRGADARRTKRQRAAIEQGVHPLGLALYRGLRIHPRAEAEERTCGNCQFRDVINAGTQRSYPKCLVDKGPYSRTNIDSCPYPRVSKGAGTDVRKWWPACVDHEFGDNGLGPDAARSGPATAYADDAE